MADITILDKYILIDLYKKDIPHINCTFCEHKTLFDATILYDDVYYNNSTIGRLLNIKYNYGRKTLQSQIKMKESLFNNNFLEILPDISKSDIMCLKCKRIQNNSQTVCPCFKSNSFFEIKKLIISGLYIFDFREYKDTRALARELWMDKFIKTPFSNLLVNDIEE